VFQQVQCCSSAISAVIWNETCCPVIPALFVLINIKSYAIQMMYFDYWCRRLVVVKITQRGTALQNVHCTVAGRCKHLFRLCKYVTMFKLLSSSSSLRFFIGESCSSTSVVAVLHDLALKCTGIVCKFQCSPVCYCLSHFISVLRTVDCTSSVL
jgi:hypothetical protein